MLKLSSFVSINVNLTNSELPLTIPTVGPLATSSQENNEVQRPSSPSSNPTRTTTCCVDHSFATTTISNLRFQNRIDIDCQTESNHDTALTLACTGGHEELVALLLQRNANIEHRDKKGFTPLILAGLISNQTQSFILRCYRLCA